MALAIMDPPLRDLDINELLDLYTRINNQVKQAQLDQFIAGGENLTDELMAISLKGAIMSHFI